MTVGDLIEALTEYPRYLLIEVRPPDNTGDYALTGIAEVIDHVSYGWLTLETGEKKT